MSEAPRIRLPEKAAPGEVITIRTLLTHEMQSGLRKDKAGALIPRRIVNRFTCAFEGAVFFDVRLEPGIAANPFLEFSFRAERSGRLDFAWHDDDGSVVTAQRTLEVG
jgi:sulfur-oxidizing protein SoxZ